MSIKELLISLLKSEQSHAELYKSKSNNTEIEETMKRDEHFQKSMKRQGFSKINDKKLKKKKRHEKVCKYDYCYVELKVSFMNYADFEYISLKKHSCQNDPKKILYGKKS